MPNKLYGGLPEDKFRTMAKKAVVKDWNSNKTLAKKYGEITTRQVFVVWQTKVIQNNKALLGVNVEDDSMYYEFTWNGDEREGYLDVYGRRRHRIVKDKK